MEKIKIGNLSFSFQAATKYHVNGGLLLMGIVLASLIIANSPLSEYYTSLWTKEVHLQIGDFNFFSHNGSHMTLMNFINDALMTVFFFTVGLEIKREVLVGELSSFRQAMLPVFAACGGMIVPVIIYYSMTKGTDASGGLAIPMATDIAFSLGILSLFGSRVPISLKIFLTAFAVVDDIGGILVIALFYSSHIDPVYLLYSSAILFMLIVGNRFHVHNKWYYLGFGFVMWYLFLQSGIHATIAGVIVAFTVPATPDYRITKYINNIKDSIDMFPHSDKSGIVLSKTQISVLKDIENSSDKVISPLQSLEDSLQGLVNYIIIPLFAFANAGVVIDAGQGNFEMGGVTMAIIAGLVIGKFVGIYSFTFILIKSKLTPKLKGMTWKNLTGISLLGGIGFTVSLFIADLSFNKIPDMLNQAKIGVLAGTFIAAFLAYIVLYITLPKKKAVKFDDVTNDVDNEE